MQAIFPAVYLHFSSARIVNPATMPENSCPGIALDRVEPCIMTGGIPELLCRSPSSGVDLNQDFSRLRFTYGTCYRPKVQLVCKLHCFHLWHCSTPLIRCVYYA